MSKPENAEELAQAVAEEWLSFTEKGDASESWALASTTFKGAVTEAQWAESLQKAQSGVGRPLSRELKTAEYHSELPGARDGHYVILTYDTRFEHKQKGTETVVPELDDDGEWRVSGYFVK